MHSGSTARAASITGLGTVGMEGLSNSGVVLGLPPASLTSASPSPHGKSDSQLPSCPDIRQQHQAAKSERIAPGPCTVAECRLAIARQAADSSFRHCVN